LTRRIAAVVVLCAVLVAMLIGVGGCRLVPQNRRKYLADPTMQPTDSALESTADHKFETAREGASGGDGQTAGGGCGCSN
jgi:hypothetical protein